MRQQDKDREAFEAWLGYHPSIEESGDYEYDAQTSWAAWQAARDHYAPKVTERKAAKIMADAVYKDCHPSGHGDDLEYDAFSKDAKVAIAALRAAGMRFKEET